MIYTNFVSSFMGTFYFRGINYTKTAPEHCVVYARNWLAILGIQSEYVYYRKGKSKKRR